MEQCGNNIFLYADDSTIVIPITSNGSDVAASLNEDRENIRKSAEQVNNPVQNVHPIREKEILGCCVCTCLYLRREDAQVEREP